MIWKEDNSKRQYSMVIILNIMELPNVNSLIFTLLRLLRET